MPSSSGTKRKGQGVSQRTKKSRHGTVSGSSSSGRGASAQSAKGRKVNTQDHSSEEEGSSEEDDSDDSGEEEGHSEDEAEKVERIEYVLSDAHRAFNQRLLANSVMTYKSAETMMQEVAKDFPSQGQTPFAEKSLDDIIEDTNSFLNKYQIQIKQSKYDGLGESYVGFANNNRLETVSTKFYDEATTKLLEELIEICIESPDGKVPRDTAREDFEQIRRKQKKLKLRTTMSNSLNRLLEDKWIELGRSDQLYRLGPRTYVELKDYLKEKGAKTRRGGK